VHNLHAVTPEAVFTVANTRNTSPRYAQAWYANPLRMIRHGAGPVIIGISYDSGHLRIEVHDDGPGRPIRHQATPDSECWRGLAVIDGLIEPYRGTLGVMDDDAGGGKTVYVSMCVTGRSSDRQPSRPVR
jgi:hypothetical protein